MFNSAYLTLLKFAQLIDGSNVELPNQNLDPNNSQAVSSTVQTVLEIVFGVMGATAVLIITIASLQYILSAGDSQKVARAKDAIIYAVVGLIVAILAFAIVRFALDGVFS